MAEPHNNAINIEYKLAVYFKSKTSVVMLLTKMHIINTKPMNALALFIMLFDLI